MKKIHSTVPFILLIALSTATSTPTNPPGPSDPIQTVLIGGRTSLGFQPPILQVGQGSRVHFDFLGQNHTLTESTFESPCTKLFGTDIDTDFNNPNPGDVPNLHPFDYTFASNRPRFFYCKQGAGASDSHCRHGEVFAVNVDQATYTEFQRRTMNTLQ